MTPEEFFGAVANMPQAKPVSYRLYHDAQGRPLFYSMEDLPGTYIEISQEAFAQNQSQVRVVGGKLVEIQHSYISKLTPSDQGTLCDARDVAIVVTGHGTYWNKKTYESN